MKMLFSAPLLVLGLAACSGEAEEPKDMADIEAEADKIASQVPGRYRTTTQIIEVKVDGVVQPDSELNAGDGNNGITERCVTQDEADRGVKEMIRALSQPEFQAQCDFTEFAVNGADVDAKIACQGPFGTGGDIAVAGQVEPESFDILLDMKFDASVMGNMDMKMKINSERVGECTADDAVPSPADEAGV